MKLIDRLLHRDRPEEITEAEPIPDWQVPRDDKRTFRIGGGWGNHVSWLSYEAGSVYGHLPVDLLFADVKKPIPGDILLAKMQSGRTGRFIFTEVTDCRDPKDMFTGRVTADGYEDDE